jgi:acyl-CoA thioesterase-1
LPCGLGLKKPASAKTSILLLGDSLSASLGMKQSLGWVHLLNQQLAITNKPYTIINASISGETTGGALSRLTGILSKRKIDHLLIELGGNDGLRGFPPKLIKNNLLQIIDIAHKENIPVTMFNILIPPNYGPRYNKMFSTVFKEVSEIKEVSLLPFFMESIAIDKDLMQADGIHPNEKAQKYIVEIVGKQLNTLLGVKAQSIE